MMYSAHTRIEKRDRGLLPRPTRRRGTVMALTALLIAVLAGMVAFAIDLGYIVHVRTELQRTADASALAGAMRLPDQTAASSIARAVATENGYSFGKIGEGDLLHGEDLDPMTIRYGFWHRDTATFTSPPPSGRDVNAVRVTLRRTEATQNPLGLFFARVFDNRLADVNASATAIYDRWLCGPFVGIDSLSAPGGLRTDSYDSYDGAYSMDTAGHRGSVCSDGPLSVEGNAVIQGDARAGKGHFPTLEGGAVVTRSVGSRQKPLNMPPVDTSEAALINDNDQIPPLLYGNDWVSPVDEAGNFLLDGTKSLDLPAGTYYFNDFTLEGQAILNVTGPTTIYITGNLYRGGGCLVTNITQDPNNLQIYMTGGWASVTSNDDFYGVIYAPNTAVTVDGDADLYGAVVAKTLTVTGSGTAHYDTQLGLEGVELPRRATLVD